MGALLVAGLPAAPRGLNCSLVNVRDEILFVVHACDEVPLIVSDDFAAHLQVLRTARERKPKCHHTGTNPHRIISIRPRFFANDYIGRVRQF